MHLYQFRDLDSAVLLYEKCLTINPKNASTYTALGFAHHMRGEFRTALNYYHKAHFLRHEDPLTEELIQRALHDVNEYALISGTGLFSTNDESMVGVSSSGNALFLS